MLSPVQGSTVEDEPERYDWDAIQVALKRYVRGRGARHDVVDDVTQETLARLVELAGKQQIGSVFALAFRIADNILVDLYRRDRHLSDDMADDRRSEDPSLNRVLDSRRAMDVFVACLKRMPTLRREVLVRRRVRLESCRTIADELALSPKAVEKHITRGMIDLRHALDHAGIDLMGCD